MSSEPIPPSIMFEIRLKAYINDNIIRMGWRLRDAGFTDEQIKKIQEIARNEFNK